MRLFLSAYATQHAHFQCCLPSRLITIRSSKTFLTIFTLEHVYRVYFSGKNFCWPTCYTETHIGLRNIYVTCLTFCSHSLQSACYRVDIRRGADKSSAFRISPFPICSTTKRIFFLDGLKKLEQRSRKCVELWGGVGGGNM
jgi:hypothetical protein